ncbi:ParA family protein [Halorubrum distributum]|uniref:AAA family ATPase n=1 Tax=Halorubrum distributum TaxID=29283 RepID=A0A6B1IJ73_9EURY|nr:ParA family protein [Halorubrum terrestre]MYL67038.1 AAA family ATPase [Halorubrum terrestre]
MTSKIAVSNQKGGVGKTTTTINVAGALANQGQDVLLVDLDPQGHATEGLGLADVYESSEPHLGSALATIDEVPNISDIVYSQDEFDVVPANVDMFTLETDLTGAMRSRERLQLLFDALDYDYDFVVVDCPPSLGHLTDNALLACQNVLIPALAEGTSIRALEILYDQIESIEQGYDLQINELGLVANRVEHDGEAAEMMDWFDDTFGDQLPVWEIRKRVALKRAWNNGVSIFAHEEDSDMEAEFAQIATHLEEVA